MKNMRYGGVYGSVKYSKEDKCFHGKIKGISDLITYEGSTKEELCQCFKEVVDMWHKDRARLTN
jgi:predicted HicB family RNase H-like nuclease